MAEYNNQDEEDYCIDCKPSEDLMASLAEDIHNSIVGNEDSHIDIVQIEHIVQSKGALEACATMSLLLDESNPDNRSF